MQMHREEEGATCTVRTSMLLAHAESFVLSCLDWSLQSYWTPGRFSFYSPTHAGTTSMLGNKAPRARGNLYVGSRRCSENCGFRIAQVVRCHCENGISHANRHCLSRESCSESTPDLRELRDKPSESVCWSYPHASDLHMLSGDRPRVTLGVRVPKTCFRPTMLARVVP